MAHQPLTEPADATPEADQFLETVRPATGVSRILNARAIDVPVPDGTIRVYHAVGEGRPVVFVSGWGTIRESFDHFYRAVSPNTEVFHVETREKASSGVKRRARFDMDRFALDIRAVLEHFQLARRDPVLMGTCFGSAVILHGLAGGILAAPTVVCVDPMTKLWMARWIVVALAALPLPVIWVLRPLIRGIVLAGMREPVQRARAASFINSAVLWKWRRAALATRKWDFFDHAASIPGGVFILNGSHDRFHNAELFPSVAAAILGGVFVRVPVGEAKRERLMGVAATVFARADPSSGVPPALRRFASPVPETSAVPHPSVP